MAMYGSTYDGHFFLIRGVVRPGLLRGFLFINFFHKKAEYQSVFFCSVIIVCKVVFFKNLKCLSYFLGVASALFCSKEDSFNSASEPFWFEGHQGQ